MTFVNRAGDPVWVKPEKADMALILRFPNEARTPSAAVAQPGVSAQILFFTGVRYERTAKKKPARRPRRRRSPRGAKTAQA